MYVTNRLYNHIHSQVAQEEREFEKLKTIANFYKEVL